MGDNLDSPELPKNMKAIKQAILNRQYRFPVAINYSYEGNFQ